MKDIYDKIGDTTQYRFSVDIVYNGGEQRREFKTYKDAEEFFKLNLKSDDVIPIRIIKHTEEEMLVNPDIIDGLVYTSILKSFRLGATCTSCRHRKRCSNILCQEPQSSNTEWCNLYSKKFTQPFLCSSWEHNDAEHNKIEDKECIENRDEDTEIKNYTIVGRYSNPKLSFKVLCNGNNLKNVTENAISYLDRHMEFSSIDVLDDNKNIVATYKRTKDMYDAK